MTPHDTMRGRVYTAERMAFNMFERASSARTVQVVGTELTLPPEARFASVDSVRDYVGRVTGMAAVRVRFPRAVEPILVRERRGHRSAHYTRRADGRAEVAVPFAVQGRWALRELVVLHELAHHFDDSGGAAHGREFVVCLIDLVGLVLGPEAELVYRVIFSDSGVGP